MKNRFIEIWGWYGAVALLVAYALSSFHFLNSDNVWYQFLNLTGASGIVAVSLLKKAYPPAALNFVWLIVALIALSGIIFR